MAQIAVVMVVLVAVLHVVFAAAETVGWSGFARRMGYGPERIEATRQLAANQGAYNFGVAAMLGWSLYGGQAGAVSMLLLFIVAMSIVGATTVRWTIFLIQGVPAILALGCVTMLA